MRAEVGQHGRDAVDRLPQPGGDGLARPLGGARPEPAVAAAEARRPAELGQHGAPFGVEALRAGEVVVGAGGVEVGVEVGEPRR